MQVTWSHFHQASGNESGVLLQVVQSLGNGDIINAGGYIDGHSTTTTETNGNSAQGCFPMVASYPVWNETYSQWDWVVGWAVPNLPNVTAHIWYATA